MRFGADRPLPRAVGGGLGSGRARRPTSARAGCSRAASLRAPSPRSPPGLDYAMLQPGRGAGLAQARAARVLPISVSGAACDVGAALGPPRVDRRAPARGAPVRAATSWWRAPWLATALGLAAASWAVRYGEPGLSAPDAPAWGLGLLASAGVWFASNLARDAIAHRAARRALAVISAVFVGLARRRLRHPLHAARRIRGVHDADVRRRAGRLRGARRASRSPIRARSTSLRSWA